MQKQNIMKKKNWMLRSFVALLALMMCLVATGCGEGDGGDVVIGGNNGSNGDNGNGQSYSFVHNNIKITPNDLMAPLVPALGTLNVDYTYHESPSCAYIGLDKIYMCKGFWIYTYPDNNSVDHVLRIVFTDDTVSTPEGLRIGDSAQKVTQLYGTDYTGSNGSFAYTLGKTILQVIVKNDIVNSIQYNYVDAL